MDEELAISYLEESYTRTERWRRLAFDCECNACTDELSFYKAALRRKYGKDENEIFAVTGEGGEDSNDDKDAPRLIEMHNRVFSDPLYYDYELAVAMDAIAAIFIAWPMNGDEGEPASHLETALNMKHQELKTLESCLGLQHEHTENTEKQIDDLKQRLEKVQGA